MAAAGAAFDGRTVAFADPMGVYIQSFASDVFFVGDEPIPTSWIRWRRGRPGMYQRLEFGPPDSDSRFLDDILVSAGASERPLTGGFDVLAHIEVGPRLLVGPKTDVGRDEYVRVRRQTTAIRCERAPVCGEISSLLAGYEAAHRGLGPGGSARGGGR
jgi:hypothetical protein